MNSLDYLFGKLSGDAQFQKQSVFSEDLGMTVPPVHKRQNDIQNKIIKEFCMNSSLGFA